MKLENTPRIEIQTKQIYNDSTKTNYVTQWSVVNNNSKISNFEIEEEFSFLNIAKRKNGKEIDIPLIEYRNREGKLTGENEGLIYQFDNKYCSNNEFSIRQEVWNYGYVDVKSFIEISYNNVLGTKEFKYYQIKPLIQEISKSSWESVAKDWKSKNTNVMDLKNIEKNIQTLKKYLE